MLIFLNISPSYIINAILHYNNLTNTIHEPTIIKHSMQTLIDPILTSQNLTIAKTGTLHTLHRLSDHKASTDARHPYKRILWHYKDADTDKFNFLIETFH